MKIYTKTGDFGMTSTLGGRKVSKADVAIDLQGSIDEINAHIGHIRSGLPLIPNQDKVQALDIVLEEIQYNLYLIGVDLSSGFERKHISNKHIEMLEKEIDRMTNEMPQNKTFIHYSGTPQTTSTHIARTVVRRAERVFVAYLQSKEIPFDYTYINRLSDYVFTLARYFNFLYGIKDEPMVIRD